MKRRLAIITTIIAIVSLSFSNVCFAGAWSEYAISYVYEDGTRGIKGDFKLPSINANWTSTYDSNFITFEEWMPVNGTTGDWFEIGYTDGAIDPENDGTTEDYTGFYKAKRVNGAYWEAKLVKTATVGTRYTFTIVDVNAQNLWEIYIGSTYFGSFADSVSSSTGQSHDQGYEINIEPGSSTPTVSSTDITNHYYRKNGSWVLWSSDTVNTYDDTSRVNVSYSSTDNKSTFTAQ